MDKTIICAAANVDIVDAPEEIKILPLGHVKSRQGDFFVDDESYRIMSKVFKERNIDIVVDYEHQTLQNVQAPAGGWIKELILGTDAIIAKVEWTPKAREYIQNKEYKYLSPVVLVREKDHKAIVLQSVALTNTPAIDGMFAIVNSLDIETQYNNLHGGTEMDIKKLAELLGLPEEATEEDILKAIAELSTKTEAADKESDSELVANKTVLGLLGLPDTAKTEDVTASIVALKAAGMDVKGEVLALKDQIKKKEVTELVQNAVKSGKITADMSDWATEYALKDTEGFKKFIEKAPEVVPVGMLDVVDAPAGEIHSKCDMKVLKMVGVTEDDLKKYVRGE